MHSSSEHIIQNLVADQSITELSTRRFQEKSSDEVSAVGSNMFGRETADILGVQVLVADRTSLTRSLSMLSPNGRQAWISYANVHAVNLAQSLPWFRDYFNRSLITYCDGAGLQLASRILGKSLPQRITLTDWIFDVCSVAQERHWRIFLLGTTEAVLRKSVDRLNTLYPALEIVGSQHGYFTPEENRSIVSRINTAHADLLLVAMGMPKQERWIVENGRLLNVPVIMNGGSCLDYLSGAKRRCPKWMGKTGLEWLYRLVQEPRRLWRRYLLGNPHFIFRVVRSRFLTHTRSLTAN